MTDAQALAAPFAAAAVLKALSLARRFASLAARGSDPFHVAIDDARVKPGG